MERGFWAWRAVGAVALIAACGGDPFVLGDASPDGSTHDAAPRDGGGADAPPSVNVVCGNMTCTSMTCCLGGSFHCTSGTCSPCETVLGCASDANCPFRQHCCIHPMPDSTCNNSVYYVAGCTTTSSCSSAGGTAICDTNNPACPSGSSCSISPMDLASVRLPTNQGYGVCL
jgi:hypothetical protein